jgi:predicted transcriptional regulator
MPDLSTNERLVLDVVQEYLDKNRTFNITEILPFLNSRFKSASIKINETGIKKILKSLVKKRYVFKDSKLTKNVLLENKIRKEIYEFILEYSGTFFNKLLKHFKVNNKVIVWHIRMLEKFGFIKRKFFDKRFIYFDSQMNFDQVKPLYYMSKEKCKQIFTYLQYNNTGVTKTKIAEDLNMHFNTVTRYLVVLESIDLIIKEKIDNNLLYFLK